MAPQSVARGAPRSGDRAASGMPDRAKVYMGRQQPATGSHLPSEETAPPCAVSPDFTATLMGRDFAGGLPCQAPGEGDQPFASSPFAHPIPQSHRRASGDLFSASLKLLPTHPADRDHGQACGPWFTIELAAIKALFAISLCVRPSVLYQHPSRPF